MSTLLDTRAVAPSDRPEYWSAGIAEHFFPMGVESVGPRPFEARLTGGRVGAVAVRSIIGAPHTARRTSRMIAEGDPDCILLYLLRNGSCRIEQDDRSCVLGPGALAFHDTSRPSTFEARDGLDVAVFSFPKWLLGARGNGIVRRTAMKIPHGKESVVRICTPFLAGLARTAESSPVFEQEAEGLSDVLVAMLWTLHSGSDAGPTPATRSSALLGRMRHYTLEHLHDPGLGPEQIARAHFVSTRYVHKLFAASGCGVSAWIREQRLERALAELRQSSDASIASIASRWGYRDPASFSRVFRQTYGCSPRDLRRGA
ncbi:helix-turn-helix domain-containing protein [Streptomyces sp. NBC_01589]|uniref:helix-turn-helix domain-containing protein n=1 Tax=unclassified Streptomyces TaxID=2593676 RepID=UPI0038667AB9